MFHEFKQCIFNGSTRLGGATMLIRKSHDGSVPEMYEDRDLTLPILTGNVLTTADGWGRCWMPAGQYDITLSFGELATTFTYYHIPAGKLGIEQQRISPYDFGAIPGVTRDYTAEIQKASDAVRQTWINSDYCWGAVFDFDDQTYRADHSVDFGGIRQPGLRIQNGTLYTFAGPGEIALDMGGNNQSHIHNFTVYGANDEYGNDHLVSAPNAPDWGIYYGRAREKGSTGGFPAAGITVTGTSGTRGYFRRGGCLAFAGEVTTYGEGVRWYNKHRALPSVGLHHVSCMDQVTARFGSPAVSRFRDLPPAGDRESNICHGWGAVNIQHQADIYEEPVAGGISATTPPVMRLKPGKVAANHIIEDMQLFISKGSIPKLSNQVVKAVNVDYEADTFELYEERFTEDGKVSLGWFPIDGTGMPIDTSGMSIQNRTGPALAIGGARVLTAAGAYFNAFGNPCIEVEPIAGSSITSWDMQVQFERQQDVAIKFLIPGAEDVATVSDINITLPSISQVTRTAHVLVEGDGRLVWNAGSLKIPSMGGVPLRGSFAPRPQIALRGIDFEAHRHETSPIYPIEGEGEFVSLSGVFQAYNTSPRITYVGQNIMETGTLEFGPPGQQVQTRGFRMPPGALINRLRQDYPEANVQITLGGTAADLENIRSILNGPNKHGGAMGWNNSEQAPAWATGGNPAARWRTFSAIFDDMIGSRVPEARERVLSGTAAFTIGGAVPPQQKSQVTFRRRGSMVHLDGYVQLTAATELAGTLRIGWNMAPLPTSRRGSVTVARVQGMQALTGQITGSVSTSGIDLEMFGPTGTTALTEANLGAGSLIRFTASYDCGRVDDGWTVARARETGAGQTLMIFDAPQVLAPRANPGSRQFDIIG